MRRINDHNAVNHVVYRGYDHDAVPYDYAGRAHYYTIQFLDRVNHIHIVYYNVYACPVQDYSAIHSC